MLSTRLAVRAAGRVLSAVPSRTATIFKVPTRDIKFVMDEVLDADNHYKRAGFEEVDAETRHSILEECTKFAEERLVPLNHVGDQEGCKLDKATGNVKTATGFKEAYETYASMGMQGMTVPEEFGGQGMPLSLALIKSELVACANWSWGMFPGLAMGCMNTLLLHGSQEQKDTYLTKLASGEWLGTMCLTEPHCGTDLAQVKTKAVKQDDGTYRLTGTKIFISCGEHDWTENIVHIVLARTPDAPKGTKGISLFLVPKHVIKPDGSLESKKNLTCGGLEEKMGIHGSSTCVMNFDNTTGYLIGEEQEGLHQMFTFMNTARIGTALQGLCASELGYQGALSYAKDRGSMRALSGTKAPERVSDPIIHHGDVRRMLLTSKAFAEGSRCMIYTISMMSDAMLTAKTPEEHKKVDEDLGFLTPILKGFITEVGIESANLGMQCFGGHGYIRDWGMEQNVRDARIGTLYEGTTGIQALDLLGRKILLQGGASFRTWSKEVFAYCKKQLWDNRKESKHKMETLKIVKHMVDWLYMTARIGLKARNRSNADVISCACVDYLMYSGYVSMGYYWLRMMDVAQDKLKDRTLPAKEVDFYHAKIQTGQFYFDHLLPRAKAHMNSALADPKSTMGADAFHERD